MFNFYKVSLVMTWSLTLSGLPREGSILKLRQYKQKLQKMNDLSKTWVLTWEHFEDLRRKKTEKLFLTFQKNPVEHMAPKRNCPKRKW